MHTRIVLAAMTCTLATTAGALTQDLSDTNAAPAPAHRTRTWRQHPVRWLSDVVMREGDRLDRRIADTFSAEEARHNEVFDRFYGDRRLEDDENRSYVRLSPRVEYEDGDGVTPYVRASLKLSLPRTSDRLQLVFDNFNDDADIVDTALQRRPPDEPGGEEGRQTLSLRLSLREALHYRLSFDTGLRFRPEPDPRLQLRFRVWSKAGPVILRGSQNIFWELQDGLGEKSEISIDRGSETQNLARASSSVIWSETSDGVKGAEVLSFHHSLGVRRAIGLTLGVSAPLEPPVAVDKYTVQVPYRWRLHKNWLFLELTPGVDFPRERDFQETPFITLKFDLIFGYTAPL